VENGKSFSSAAGAAKNPARSTAGRAAAKRADETGEQCTPHNAVRPRVAAFFADGVSSAFFTLSVRSRRCWQVDPHKHAGMMRMRDA
jgi:hypothetical protein